MEKVVQLTSSLVLQFLGDVEFYKTNPIYLFMMDNGMAVSRQYQDLVNDGKKCVGCIERSISNTLGTFAMQTRLAARIAPRQLMPLLDYLQTKLGYAVGAATLYYKDAGGRQWELRFGPNVRGYVQDALSEQGGSNGPVHPTPSKPASAGSGPQPGPGLPT